MAQPRKLIPPYRFGLFHQVAIGLCSPESGSINVAEALVTSFCRFRALQELHSDQDCNFRSRLMQEVFNAWK
jgi:hypothetical protein